MSQKKHWHTVIVSYFINMKKILFISRASSKDRSAYTHRLERLRLGLEKLGFSTDILYLGNTSRTAHTLIPTYIPELSRMFRLYDFLHAGGTPCAWVANLCKPFHHRKVIYDIHGDRIGEILEGNPFSLFKTILHEMLATWYSDLYITVCEPLKQLYVRRGIHSHRIAIIRNGVDLHQFRPSPSIKHKCTRIFAYAGKFQWYQAVDDLVKAVLSISSSKIQCEIIGFSEEDHKIKSRIQKLAGQKIRLVEELNHEALIRRLHHADVLVIPRRYSRATAFAFPTKFAEYIALAKPVLVSHVDETAKFVQHYSCGMVYGEGPEALRETIEKMANVSDEKLHAMGIQGRRLAETVFDWGNICKKYAQFLMQW